MTGSTPMGTSTAPQRAYDAISPEAFEPAPVDLLEHDPDARQSRWGTLLPVVVTLVLIGALELFTRYGPLRKSALPPPSAITRRLVHIVQQGDFWSAVASTMQGWAGGLGLAVVFAIPFGLLLGTNRWLFQSFKFLLDFVRPIPSIALLPLFILIFGINMTLKVYITGLGAFFPLLFQTMYGVQDVDPVARDTARAYGFNWPMRFIFVDLLGATPYIATGIRIAASVSLVVAVAAELLIGIPGLGREVFLAQTAADNDSMYAYITATGILGIGLALVFAWLERTTLHWHPSQRGEQAG